MAPAPWHKIVLVIDYYNFFPLVGEWIVFLASIGTLECLSHYSYIYNYCSCLSIINWSVFFSIG